jgi:glycosyltransferase involved in cell wall biosynthesis/peptidoglycan/xylan/chitin deacetylase (PgdA/CDA1 family)
VHTVKIWHVGAAPNPYRVDGVSRTVWLMSLEQARLGHDVSLILYETPTPEAVQMAGEVGLKLHDMSASPLAFAKHVRELVETVPPQVVHMHSVFIPRQATMARVLRKARIPYVITPHAGLAPQVLSRGRLKKGIYSALRERPRFMGAAAVALVTPAEEKAVRSYLPDYGGIVRWMPNPVDFSTLDPHRWHGIHDDPKRLVFLGRFDVLVKGIDILIEIARALPEVKVDLYGTEDPKTRDWLMKLKENLPANVSFNDPIFGGDKAEVLSRASIYIQPSRWEGFPVSVAECLYLGVPSAITETLDLSELFREHELGLVLSLAPEQAAAQLRAALSDAKLMDEWSQRGRAFAIEHFAPAAVAENHLRLYQEVIDNAAAANAAADAAAATTEGARRAHAAGIAHPGGNGQAHVLHDYSSGYRAPRRRIIPARMRASLKQNVSRFVERGSGSGRGSGGVRADHTPAARTIVLCYHSINDAEHGLTIAPDAFRAQLRALKDMGFAFHTFGDFVQRVMRWGSPRGNVAVITFDDGFEDNCAVAAPILAEMRVPATFFITTGLMQRDEQVMRGFEQLTNFRTTFVSPQQVAQLHAAGFEIGAHTHTHPRLAALAPERARWEIEHGKRLLEDVIGAPVQSFAYPFGKPHIHYTAATVNLVRESGFRGAAAVSFRAVTARSAVRIFEIPRFFITRADAETQFRQKVAGHFDWVGAVQEMTPAWLKGLVSPEEKY